MLERARLNGDKLFLYTQKTGTPVWVPLPPNVVEALHRSPSDNGRIHRCRDTFAVELLLKGVPIEQVSVLLGRHARVPH